MDGSDLAIVFATLIGPILAVQAQKWLERRREIEGRKVNIFATLMATRATRLAPEHVRALNTIELAFYGTQVPGGRPKRSLEDNAVVLAWREYYRHLNTHQDQGNTATWFAQLDELFLNLLEKLAVATNYEFDRDQLRSAHYSPQGHHQMGEEQDQLRRLAIDVLSGKAPIAFRAAQDRAEG